MVLEVGEDENIYAAPVSHVGRVAIKEILGNDSNLKRFFGDEDNREESFYAAKHCSIQGDHKPYRDVSGSYPMVTQVYIDKIRRKIGTVLAVTDVKMTYELLCLLVAWYRIEDCRLSCC